MTPLLGNPPPPPLDTCTVQEKGLATACMLCCWNLSCAGHMVLGTCPVRTVSCQQANKQLPACVCCAALSHIVCLLLFVQKQLEQHKSRSKHQEDQLAHSKQQLAHQQVRCPVASICLAVTP